MGVPRCRICPNCKTTLAEGPEEHRDPEPHQFYLRFEKMPGKDARVWKECKQCQTQESLDPKIMEQIFANPPNKTLIVEGSMELTDAPETMSEERS